MKTKLLVLPLVALASGAFGQARPTNEVIVADSNSTMLVKMDTSLSSATNKPGDPVRGVLIDPRHLRGDRVEGKVIRSDHAILNFEFDKVYHNGRAYPMESRLISVTSSKGNEGRDDLDQRLRIEGVGIITFGTTTAIDEGAEIRITAWKPSARSGSETE